MTELDSLPTIPCNECRAGIMQPRHITYFTWLGSELIMVPHFPSWVCDLCGRREYDEKAIQWLNMLLSPNTGNPTTSKRRTPPPPRPQTGARRPISKS
ncbi:MAG: YgiT-type zinc finger protein [Anaerolineaceae bacterium]|jgi:YgiT-type zinc finger domain-containing protein|nr:MAG: YgiT-type zinc finger protein [Anaerolineaceae bacterium]